MIDYIESWIEELNGEDRSRAEYARHCSELSVAGAELRRLRQHGPPKVFTGRLGHGRRGYVGQTVVLPDRSLARLIKAKRGWAVVAWVDPHAVQPRRIGYLEADLVQPYRNPCAVMLGRLKAGRREVPSEAKRRAARRNGSCPVRLGSRPRGRPRRSPVGRGEHIHDSTGQCA